MGSIEKQQRGGTARGDNGRFLPTRSVQKAADEQGHQGMQKREERNSALFQGYINAFFIIGDEKDFIPYSSKSGPFVLTYEKIMRPTFAMGRTKRSAILKDFYDVQKRQKIPSKIARITARDFRFPKGKSSRVDVYMYRRMPRLNSRRSELERLKAFLKRAQNENSLAVSQEEAYTICCEAMGTYKNANGKMAYIGFPITGSRKSLSPSATSSDRAVEGSPRNEVSPNLNDNPLELRGHSEDDSETGEPHSSIEAISHENSAENNCARLHEGDNQLLPPTRVRPSPSSRKYLSQVALFLKIARTDSTFEVLNKSLDDRHSKFHLTAIPFAVPSLGSPKVPKVLKDTLTHCQGRLFETKNQSELRKIETNLRDIKDDFAKVRDIYELKKVEDMNWSFD